MILSYKAPKKVLPEGPFFLERCVFSTSICTTGTKAPRKDVFLPFYFQETNSTTEKSTVPRERAQKVTLRVSKSTRANSGGIPAKIRPKKNLQSVPPRERAQKVTLRVSKSK